VLVSYFSGQILKDFISCSEQVRLLYVSICSWLPLYTTYLFKILKYCGSYLQALMYPLLVACKSISNLRRAAAQEVVDKVRQHSGVLVDQVKWNCFTLIVC